MHEHRLNPSYTGEITADQWNGERVIAFGDARVDEAIPSDMVWRLENPAADGQKFFNEGINPASLKNYFAFVLPESMSAQDATAVVEIQKVFIYLHYKYVYFPKNSLSTTDSFGVREEPLPDAIREINQLRNLPWFVSAPIVDKLADERLGLPFFALLPGPSMQEALPRLKDIRERCLIVCLARTLRACLSAGVQPDIVLQLDTYQVQRNFYEGLPDMPATVLVSLSYCPLYPYANKFRGVVMMDSFNLELLPNPARLRESYVSSITACLGLAEVLHSKHAFIAGANLSYPLGRNEHPYAGRTGGPMPAYAIDKSYFLEARDGTPIRVWDYFIATAREVEQFAADIRQTTGTQFYSTTESTLLSKRWFPQGGMEAVEALPAIDREAYLSSLDKVLSQREKVHTTRLRMELTRKLDEMRGVEAAYRGGMASHEELEQFVLSKAVRKMRNPRLHGDVDHVAVATKVSSQWREALNNARLLAQAITLTERGKPVHLLCMESEVEELQGLLGKFIQGSKWKLATVLTPPFSAFGEAEIVLVDDFYAWLGDKSVVFASPRMMKEYSYVMEYAPNDNIYDMRPMLGQG